MFCCGTIFLEEGFLIFYQECEESVRTFPSSFRLVPHNVSGISATLWLTMWTECEEFVSLNEDPYYCCIFDVSRLEMANSNTHSKKGSFTVP